MYDTLRYVEKKQLLWCIENFIKDSYPDEDYITFCERVDYDENI